MYIKLKKNYDNVGCYLDVRQLRNNNVVNLIFNFWVF